MEIEIINRNKVEIKTNNNSYFIENEKETYYLYVKYENEDITYYICGFENFIDALIYINGFIK